MPAIIVTIADAAKDVLNAATLSQAFEATRAYIPTFGKQEEDADELAVLRVTVVPRRLTMETLSRRDDDFSYVIDIGVQKRLPEGTATDADVAAAADPLMLLAEEVMDLFRGKSLAGVSGVTCMAAENTPIYAPEHMDEHRVFTSVISLTFRLSRMR